jgi:hypothetical protein
MGLLLKCREDREGIIRTKIKKRRSILKMKRLTKKRPTKKKLVTTKKLTNERTAKKLSMRMRTRNCTKKVLQRQYILRTKLWEPLRMTPQRVLMER